MDQEIIRRARVADLAAFLAARHYDDIKMSSTGISIWLKDRPYVCTRKGYVGFVDYHTGKQGNAIDFLVNYLDYSFQDAVYALEGYAVPLPNQQHDQVAQASNTFVIPDAAAKPYTRVFRYLSSRGIPDTIIQRLVNDGLLFQDADHGNAVFLSRAKDFCELRGTMPTKGKPFHGIRRLYPYCFWSCRNSTKPVEVAYLCEASIDAISLAILRSQADADLSAAYVSIGGVANQQTIDRIHRSIRTVLAVDHDEAGQWCRERNPALEVLLPVHKDWNEDLMAGETGTRPVIPAESRPTSQASEAAQDSVQPSRTKTA